MAEATAASFHCPACRAPLRLRDRRFLGASFPCPDCQSELVLLELQDGTATVQLATTPSANPPKTGAQRATQNTALQGTREAPKSEVAETAAAPVRKAKSGTRSPAEPPAASSGQEAWWREWLLSPLVISWTIAGVFGLTMTVLILRDSASSPQPVTPATDQAKTGDTREDPLEGHSGELPAAAAGKPAWMAATTDTVSKRLEKLGTQLTAFADQHEEFPHQKTTPAAPAAGRWSWLSVLERNRQPELAPAGGAGTRSWDDPTAERFVRRQVPEFQNPSLATKVGERGYPTSHFAGVAGVGADAADLPADHPRAGIFRQHSPTRRNDIQDGAANTIAVMGIESGFGSWAEGGRATARALTAEPYLHGPDGFGTGSEDEMQVLMADGSVRTVNANTDPRLMRRMAAMADGLPLDLNIPGEPGDRPIPPPVSAPPVMPVAENPPDEPPVSALPVQNPPVREAILRPDPLKVQQQTLASFEMTAPRPRRELFSLVEDFFGRPVRWTDDELGARRAVLDEPVTIRRESITVGELLQELLAGTGLEFVIGADEIRLQPAQRR